MKSWWHEWLHRRLAVSSRRYQGRPQTRWSPFCPAILLRLHNLLHPRPEGIR